MATQTTMIPINWPGEVRLPIVLTFEHESGEGAPMRPGDRPQANQYGQMEYGARRGIFNVLEMLDRFDIKATFFVNGVTAEKFPEGVRAAHAAGHEMLISFKMQIAVLRRQNCRQRALAAARKAAQNNAIKRGKGRQLSGGQHGERGVYSFFTRQELQLSPSLRTSL